MAAGKRAPRPFPSKEEVLAFIREAASPPDKKEIARADAALVRIKDYTEGGNRKEIEVLTGALAKAAEDAKGKALYGHRIGEALKSDQYTLDAKGRRYKCLPGDRSCTVLPPPGAPLQPLRRPKQTPPRVEECGSRCDLLDRMK